MAEPYRYHQPGAGQYYQQHNQQVYHQRHLVRNGSPVNGSRAHYSNETPSPSRSPVSQNSSHIPFNMFNQGHQPNQHALMNGGNSHQRFMQMNIQHKFQHPPHQTHHTQQTHHQQQAHGGIPGHNGIGHQHTFSAGMLSNSTSNYTSNGVQNGSPNEDEGELAEHISEHWQEQLQLAAEQRQSAGAVHRHSKKAGAVSSSAKGVVSSVPSSDSQKEAESGERYRAAVISDDLRQDWDGLDLSGQGLRVLSGCLFNNYSFLTKLFIDNNKITALPASISQLRNLELLQASNNQLRGLPDSIGMLVNLKHLLLFDNNIHTLPCEIGHLHRLEMLGIEGNPLKEEYKEVLIQEGTKALIVFIRDSTEAGTPPRPRERIIMDDSEATEYVSVLDYNILCDKYATVAQYGYTPTKALSWEYRRELILNEIRSLDADIVCLQEIDVESYNEYFRKELAMQHYKGVFWPKARARTMADKDARLVDGCATFYKGQKYILLDKHNIDFANTAINRPDMKGEHDIFNRVMPRDHIAVICFFENRLTGSRLIAVNAHIFWDPVFEDVKLVQVAILMETITKLAEKWASHPPCMDKAAFRHTEQDDGTCEATDALPIQPGPSLEYSEGSQIPLIICGDFNCAKGSGIYDLLERGVVAHDHEDLRNRSYGNFTRDGMSHPFHLKSAYDGETPDGEPLLEFTNYTPGFSGSIDYIWHSTNTLRVKQVLGNIDNEYLQTVPGFPNYHFPSDHLPLFVEFSLEARKERPKAVEADFGPQKERRN